MDGVHVHLILNHVPVLGSVFGLGLLGAGLVRRSAELQRAAMVGLVLSALVALPVMLTGESAEEAVEEAPGVTEEAIEEHEEAAEAGFAAVVVAGLAALAALGWGWKAGRTPAWSAFGVAGLALVAAALLGWAAGKGGRIRHTEIRGPSSGHVVEKR